MKKSFLAFLALSIAVIMSSCSTKNEVIEKNGPTPLKFRVSTGKITKSNAGEINDLGDRTITVFVHPSVGNVIDATGTSISSFYLKTTSGMEPGTTTSYSDFAGTIPLALYLTEDADVEFGALAGNDTDGDEIDFYGSGFSFNGTDITYDGYTSLPLNETVYAIATGITQDTETIALNFKHIVSQVMFAVAKGASVSGDGGDELNIQITDLSVIDVPTTGDLTATASGAACANFGYGGYGLDEMETTSTQNMDSNTAVDDNNNAITSRKEEFTSFFVLPWTIDNANAKIAVTYNITAADGTTVIYEDLTQDIPFSGLGSITKWESGRRYTYIFKPGTLTPLAARITVTAEKSPWEDDLSNEIEVED